MKPATLKSWSAVHTWTSLVCTAFLLMLCVTGLGMIWLSDLDAMFAAHPPVSQGPMVTRPADLDAMFAKAEAMRPGERVTYADWAFEGDLVGVNMARADDQKKRTRQLIFDARNGAYLEDTRKDNPNQPVRVFLRTINRLHIEMFAGLPGEYFLAAMATLFVAATVSGVVLYGPFTQKLAFGTVRSDRSARAGWLDIHNLVGIATVGWVLVVSITGVMNAFTVPAYAAWRKAALPALVAPFKGRPPLTEAIGPMRALDVAQAAVPGSRMVRIVTPGARDGSPRHYVVWTEGDTNVTKKLFRPVLVDAVTAEVVLSAPPPWWLSALQLSRPLHFGNYGGAPLKALWTLLDLAAIVIVASGLYLWVARRRWRPARG